VPLNTEFIVGGFYSPGDGGGGTFIWVTPLPSGFVPDGGITFNSITLQSSPGYFKRLYSGPINVRWFGAKGDGVTDDTAAVHAARDSKEFANNGTLYFPKGVYPGAFDFTSKYGSPTFIRNEINLIGDGEGSVLKSNGTTGYEIPNGSIYNYPVLRLGYRQFHWRYAKITNIKIDGSFSIHS